MTSRERTRPNWPRLLADALHTQIDMHRAYGGVVPELASRDHIRRMVPLLRQVLEDGRPQLYRSRMDPLEPRASVGSGDAFLAGYVAARYGGGGPGDCLRFGTACGAESTQHLGAGVLDPRAVERLVEEISVERLEQPAEVG